MVEEALKGTSYGAALEAAERDEQLKREQRAAETGRPLMARPFTRALLGDSDSPKPPSDSALVSLLTRAQILVLETGIDQETFPLTRWQIKDSSASLIDWRLISRLSNGHYTLTTIGRSVYSLWCALWAEQDLDMTSPIPYTATQMNILDMGMNYKTFTLDRKQAGKVAGNLKHHKLIEPTGNRGEWTLTPFGRSEYERVKALSSIQADETIRPADSSVNLDDPALKPAFEVLDFSQASPPDNQALGAVAAQRQIKINQLETTVDDLGAQIDDLKQTIKALEAGQTVTTGIDWHEVVIRPLLDLVVQYDGEETRLKIENDPSLIVQGVTGLSQAFDKVEDIAEERLKVIEERDSKIESLSRCIEQLESKLLNIPSTRADVYLAGQILDELCELVPEVEDYRTARESAAKAIGKLKAVR